MEAAAGVDAAVLQPAPPRTCVSGRRRGDGRGACYCESVEVPGSWWHLTGGVDAAVLQPAPPRTCVSYGDEKAANRDIRVWHLVIENGY
jgi:hypothetical protein